MVDSVVGDSGFSITYAPTIQQDLAVTVNYDGDLKGALDAISQASGYRWTWVGHVVAWDDLESRTWQIPMVPGGQKFSSSVGGAVTTSIAGGSTNTQSGVSTDSTQAGTGSTAMGNTQTTSRFSDELSVWRDMERQIRTMLSKRGSVTVSETTSTITVRDYEQQLDAIGEFVDKMISEMRQQILVQVDVIDVTLNDSANRGIDWTAVAQEAGKWGMALSSASASAVFPSGITAPTLTYARDAGRFNGSEVLVQLLQMQGNVAIKTRPRVVTLNNQTATIQIGEEISYLAQSATTTSTSGSTTSLTPGMVRTGFLMYLLPRIQRDEIVMQLALSINDLKRIRTVESNGSSVEMPDIQTKNFQQLTRLKSGESMILTGFRQTSASYTAQGVTRVMPWLAGADSASDTKIDTIVLITPYVMGDRT